MICRKRINNIEEVVFRSIFFATWCEMITELIMIPVGQRCDDPWGRQSEGVLKGHG